MTKHETMTVTKASNLEIEKHRIHKLERKITRITEVAKGNEDFLLIFHIEKD